MRVFTFLPAILLPAFLIKSTIFGIDFAQAIVLIGLMALYAGWFYFEHAKEPEANKEIKNRLVDLEEQLKLQKDKVNAITLSAGLRK